MNSNLMSVCAVVPVYNNEKTIGAVVERVKSFLPDVIVVNDGSTDGTAAALAAVEGVDVLAYPNNRGKGHALRLGLETAAERGFRYALTIDADGQHFPEDIPAFLAQAERTPDALIIGARNLAQENMPSKNTFANRFSNFWFRLETGRKMDDTQSGFRLWPLENVRRLRFFTSGYEFELEAAVRLAWRGVEVVNIPVQVYYPPEGERVSHFKPGRDFLRISLLNSVLVIAAAVWYYPMRFVKWLSWGNIKRFVRENVTHSGESHQQLAAAIGLGVFWGIAPVWGYQMLLAGLSAHLLRLNKVVAVASSNISIPPMIPFILWGSFWVGGLVLNRGVEFSLSDISFDSIAGSLLQYAVGSIVLAVAAGATAWITALALLKSFRNG